VAYIQQKFVLTVVEAVKSTVKAPADARGEGLCPTDSTVCGAGWKGQKVSRVSFIRALIPRIKHAPHDLITSQRENCGVHNIQASAPSHIMSKSK
jgi:hypothetical protein